MRFIPLKLASIALAATSVLATVGCPAGAVDDGPAPEPEGCESASTTCTSPMQILVTLIRELD